MLSGKIPIEIILWRQRRLVNTGLSIKLLLPDKRGTYGRKF